MAAYNGAMRLVVPEREPGLLLRPLIWAAERRLGKRLAIARVLLWSPRVAIAALILELATEAATRKLPRRLAGLVRIKVSMVAECPFCIDLNTLGHDALGISAAEVMAMRDEGEPGLGSFSERETLLLEWVGAQTRTPLRLGDELADRLSGIEPKVLVAVASLSAKVNYWARLMQGLGVPTPGFQDSCPFLPEPSGGVEVDSGPR